MDKMYTNHTTAIVRSFCGALSSSSLRFTLIYLLEDISHQQYLMEDIVRLPDITFMSLDIENEHSFGASSFHVLRMCTGLRKLSLTFCDTTRHPEAQTASHRVVFVISHQTGKQRNSR